ncbi:MAG: hypothetical protein EBE86_032255 [Hormoscilla sp. GUM202]|nr:hypothetical protein [Hormoscilla sp. GM7CHS1pb]MBO1351753.1 hypothetical protein [Hormoscilla sp. GUM202]
MKNVKVFQVKEWRSLVVGVFLTAITTFLLWSVIINSVPSGIELVLITISGMTTAAALSAFKQFYQGGLVSEYKIYNINQSGGDLFISESKDKEASEN